MLKFLAQFWVAEHTKNGEHVRKAMHMAQPYKVLYCVVLKVIDCLFPGGNYDNWTLIDSPTLTIRQSDTNRTIRIKTIRIGHQTMWYLLPLPQCLKPQLRSVIIFKFYSKIVSTWRFGHLPILRKLKYVFAFENQTSNLHLVRHICFWRIPF